MTSDTIILIITGAFIGNISLIIMYYYVSF
jgi:hypothetical protein